MGVRVVIRAVDVVGVIVSFAATVGDSGEIAAEDVIGGGGTVTTVFVVQEAKTARPMNQMTA